MDSVPPATSAAFAKRRLEAFTLVEIMVAISVLALVVVMLAQITGAMTFTINRGSGQLDAVSQARFAFDRMGIDIERAPRRSDLGDAFVKQDGNDEIRFYGAITGYSGNRTVSVVDYRINPTSHQLERGVWGTLWNATDPAAENNQPLVFGTSTPPVIPNASDYEVIGPGIFRMEFYWLLKSSGGLTTDKRSLGSTDVAALVVRLAVVDGKSLNLLNNNSLNFLVSANAFPDITMSGTSSSNPMQPGAPWTTSPSWPVTIDALTRGGLPRTAAQAVRIFERTFYVDP